MSHNKQAKHTLLYVELKHPFDDNGVLIKKQICEITVVSSEGGVVYSTLVNYISPALISDKTLDVYGKTRGAFANSPSRYQAESGLVEHLKCNYITVWGRENIKLLKDIEGLFFKTYIDVSKMFLDAVGIPTHIALPHVVKALSLGDEMINRDTVSYLQAVRLLHLSLQDRDNLEALTSYKEAICLNHLEEEAKKLTYTLNKVSSKDHLPPLYLNF